MNKNISGYKKVIKLMPTGWEEKARETGALTRSRKINNAADLLKLNLLYLTSGGSFGKTSAMLKLAEDISLNKNAVYERIIKSGDWLNWLCENICRNCGLIVEKPDWLSDKQVCLIDATDEAINGSNNADYRLHYMMELFTLNTVEMHLTKANQGEKLTNFKQLKNNDIIIGDRAYGNIKSIEYAKSCGSDYIFRLKGKAFNLYNEAGEKIELEEHIGTMEENQTYSINVYYKVGNKLTPVRICAYMKTEKDYLKSLRHTKKSNKKDKRTKVSSLQDFYNRYIIVATSLTDETSKIMELYRMRWQIEMLFKRFKSIFNYDEMPSKNEKSIRAWFYGKLLLAAICEAFVNQGRFSPIE